MKNQDHKVITKQKAIYKIFVEVFDYPNFWLYCLLPYIILIQGMCRK